MQSNHTLPSQIAQTSFASIAEATAEYEALLQKYQVLQTQHEMLKENYEFSVNEARVSRDFYMNLYAELLNAHGETAA